MSDIEREGGGEGREEERGRASEQASERAIYERWGGRMCNIGQGRRSVRHSAQTYPNPHPCRHPHPDTSAIQTGVYRYIPEYAHISDSPCLPRVRQLVVHLAGTHHEPGGMHVCARTMMQMDNTRRTLRMVTRPARQFAKYCIAR